jgi:hypothetical protein
MIASSSAGQVRPPLDEVAASGPTHTDPGCYSRGRLPAITALARLSTEARLEAAGR